MSDAPTLATVTPAGTVEAVLVQGPARIEGIEAAVFQATRAKRVAEERAQDVRANVALSVATATGEDGKALYRNEDARSARVRELLAADEQYARARQAAEEQDAVIARLQRELERTRLEWKAAYALTLTKRGDA